MERCDVAQKRVQVFFRLPGGSKPLQSITSFIARVRTGFRYTL
jgi:hypothetical protein